MRRSFLLAGLAPLAAWVHPARAEPALPPALMETGGQVLAVLIHAARANAIAAGVAPIPAAVQRALRGFFPDAILRKVRWASGQDGRGITIPGYAMRYGDIDAMTFGDTILFRDEQRAREDARLWAHELTHVLQFERLGVDGFAARYVRDFATLEQEARDNADRFAAWKGHTKH